MQNFTYFPSLFYNPPVALRATAPFTQGGLVANRHSLTNLYTLLTPTSLHRGASLLYPAFSLLDPGQPLAYKRNAKNKHYYRNAREDGIPRGHKKVASGLGDHKAKRGRRRRNAKA